MVEIQEPLRGTLNLRLLDQNPIFIRYALEDIAFTAGPTRTYTVKGSGTFEIRGEVAVILEVFLQVDINDGVTSKTCFGGRARG